VNGGRVLITQELIQAYEETDYRVSGTLSFILKIGKENKELRYLFDKHGYETAAFLTAFNPYSELVVATQNEAAHKHLTEDLSKKSVMVLEGVGQDSKKKWLPEKSVLVLGLTMGDARDIGNKFRQNAFVWADADAVPRLILIRSCVDAMASSSS
tara:strand:+ start:101 stop:565 length:465 start_codon:yes stop_codon:yes gene_type:complete